MTEQAAPVTGVSSGIGRQLAKVFARHGHPAVPRARKSGMALMDKAFPTRPGRIADG